MGAEQLSLQEVLRIAKLATLPKKWSGSGEIWLKSIVHVTKCNNYKNYCIAVNDGGDKPVIVKDFGRPARIAKVNGIYPFLYMSSCSLPALKTNKDIILYLSNNGINGIFVKSLLSTKRKDGETKTEVEKEEDMKMINKLIKQVAIKNEIARLDEIQKFK